MGKRDVEETTKGPQTRRRFLAVGLHLAATTALFGVSGGTSASARSERHEEYIAYYRARAKRYAGNPLYPHSAAADEAMLRAIEESSSLDAFRERFHREQLGVRAAVARVRDQTTARLELMRELEETVRVKPYEEILQLLDSQSYESAQDVTSMVTDVETRWMQEISSDELLRDEIWSDYKILEDIEEAERAEVPEKWEEEQRKFIATEREQGAEHWREHTLVEARKFDPDYEPDYDALNESRHRRRFPVTDSVFERQIINHKKFVGEQ